MKGTKRTKEKGKRRKGRKGTRIDKKNKRWKHERKMQRKEKRKMQRKGNQNQGDQRSRHGKTNNKIIIELTHTRTQPRWYYNAHSQWTRATRPSWSFMARYYCSIGAYHNAIIGYGMLSRLSWTVWKTAVPVIPPTKWTRAGVSLEDYAFFFFFFFLSFISLTAIAHFRLRRPAPSRRSRSITIQIQQSQQSQQS